MGATSHTAAVEPLELRPSNRPIRHSSTISWEQADKSQAEPALTKR